MKSSRLYARASWVGVALCLGAVVAAVPSTRPLTAQAAAQNTYTGYAAGIDGGEPSIGYDTKADVAIYGSGTVTHRLKWDANQLTVTNVSPVTAITTLDAITVVDQVTNRSFNVQLAGGCSFAAYSDDAGANWTPSQGCGENTLLDHESLGGGPFHAPLPAGLVYPDAVYYCAQNGFNGTCALSLNGGLSFGPGIAAYNEPGNNGTDPLGGSCSALHGHIRVGPDGTAYLPLKGCGGTPTTNNLTNTEYAGGHPSLSVSEDNGSTWNIRMVTAGDNSDESDPSVGIGAKNTIYFGWENGKNPSETVGGPLSQAEIAVSHDRGKTWSQPVNVSSPMGVKNVQFPEVIAGDDDRAAFAFLGTTGIGDDQQNGFVGAWHLYISTTYDGGQTWSTVDTTPDKPMQRGCIDMQGLAPGSPKTNVCGQRNLLDFNDITVDRLGRVLVAYGDGCIGKCATNPKSASSGAKDMVMRQTTGVGLYAKYDPGFGPVSAATSPSPTSVPTPAPTSSPTSTPLPATTAGADVDVALPGVLLVLIAAAAGANEVRRRRKPG
jgi:hypothetical protein